MITCMRTLYMAAILATVAGGAAVVRAGDSPSAPADVAPPMASQPEKAEPPGEWGPPEGGLAASMRIDGEVTVGGKLTVRIALKSAAGQPVPLPPASAVSGWLLVVQGAGDKKRGWYSAKVPLRNRA